MMEGVERLPMRWRHGRRHGGAPERMTEEGRGGEEVKMKTVVMASSWHSLIVSN
jgi:hypothetical protein